jgi:hypothetical protein
MRPAPKVTPKLVVAIVEQARIEAAEEAALRIPPPLVLAVLLAGLIGVGWMVRSSWAQVPDEAATPAPPAPAPRQDLKPPGQTPSEPGNPPLPVAESTVLPPPELNAGPGAPPTDDPEKAVQAFVDQNKKTAEGQLKSLRSEAERLRARLQKVEAGIRRWESLLAAIEKSEAAAKDLGPTSLEPVTPSGRPQFRPKAESSDRANPRPRSESEVAPPRDETSPTAPR